MALSTQLLRLDGDARLARHDVLQDLVDVRFGQIFDSACADQRDDVPLDTASVGHDGGWLLRSSALTQNETCVQIGGVEGTKLLDRDGLVVELAFLGRIIAARNAPQLDLRFLPGCLWCPHAMQADGISSRASSSTILNEVAALAERTRGGQSRAVRHPR